MPKILIVDDEWLTRLEIEGMLTDLGYEVAGQAETGAEAVAMARELNPDLVLMDIKMPGEMNGIDAAREIKAELGTPIIFLSGYGDPEHIEAAKEIAPFGYVMKPFDEQEVHAFVEIALSRKKLELKLEESHERLEQTNLDLQEEIAARKKTEMALRESEEKYSKLFHSNPQWLHITTFDEGRFVETNNATKEITGYEPDELIGRTSKELGLWDDYEERTQFQKLAQEQGGLRDQEMTFIKKNGEPMSMLWSAAIIEIMGTDYFINSIADITERKRAEKALLLKEQVFETSLSANSISDDKGILTNVNSAFIRTWGYENKEEVIGKPIHDLLESENEAAKIITILNKTGKWEGEFIALKKDGTTFIAHCLGTVIRGQSGEIVGYQSAILDITEQRQTAEALRESEEKYSKFFHSNPQWLHISTLEDGLFVEANKATKKTTGYEPDELIGQTSRELGLWADYEERSRLVKIAQEQGGIQDQEVTIVKKNGESVSMLWSAATIEIMGTAYFINSVADITARKRAEEALRESEERYRFLVEESNDITWTFDLSSMTFSYFSNSAEKVLGHSPEAGLVITLDDVFSPTTKKEVLSAFGKLLEADSDSNRILMEAEHRHKDGGTVWMEINALLHRDSFNQPECLTGVSREITDRKLAEEALRESNMKFRTLFDESPHAAAVTKIEDGRLLDVNNKFCELTGYRKEEIIGKTTTDAFSSKENREKFINELKDKGVVNGLEIEVPTKSGGKMTGKIYTRTIDISGKPQLLTMF